MIRKIVLYIIFILVSIQLNSQEIFHLPTIENNSQNQIDLCIELEENRGLLIRTIYGEELEETTHSGWVIDVQNGDIMEEIELNDIFSSFESYRILSVFHRLKDKVEMIVSYTTENSIELSKITFDVPSKTLSNELVLFTRPLSSNLKGFTFTGIKEKGKKRLLGGTQWYLKPGTMEYVISLIFIELEEEEFKITEKYYTDYTHLDILFDVGFVGENNFIISGIGPYAYVLDSNFNEIYEYEDVQGGSIENGDLYSNLVYDFEELGLEKLVWSQNVLGEMRLSKVNFDSINYEIDTSFTVQGGGDYTRPLINGIVQGDSSIFTICTKNGFGKTNRIVLNKFNLSLEKEWEVEFGDGAYYLPVGLELVSNKIIVYGNIIESIPFKDTLSSFYSIIGDNGGIISTQIIDKISLDEIVVSPNPVENNLTIHLETNEKFSYKVYSMNGNLATSGEQAKNIIKVDFLKPGVYKLFLNVGNRRYYHSSFIKTNIH